MHVLNGQESCGEGEGACVEGERGVRLYIHKVFRIN